MWIYGNLRNKTREITSGELIIWRNQAFETNVRLGQLLSRVVPDVEFQKLSTKGISPLSSKRINGTAQFFPVTVLFECNVRTSNWMRKNWNRNIPKNRGFRFKSINATLSKLLDNWSKETIFSICQLGNQNKHLGKDERMEARIFRLNCKMFCTLTDDLKEYLPNLLERWRLCQISSVIKTKWSNIVFTK